MADTNRPAVEQYYDTVREAATGPAHPHRLSSRRPQSVPPRVAARRRLGQRRLPREQLGLHQHVDGPSFTWFVMIAVGAPDASLATFPGEGRQPERLIEAIDWAAENNKSEFRNRLDESKIALAGQSCCGVESFQAGGDPRVKSVASVNSARPIRARTSRTCTPTMFVSGCPSDSAFERSRDNYNSVDVPALLVDHYEAGHTGLWFGIRNGNGDTPTLAAATELLTNWLDFTLNGNDSAQQFLIGPGCTLCSAGYPWTVESEGFE
jgi:hypothetical protein